MELITVLEKTAFGSKQNFYFITLLKQLINNFYLDQVELEAARNFLEQAALHDLVTTKNLNKN